MYEPSPVFTAGKPEDYQVSEISTRFKKDYRVWMIRTSEGIHSLIAISTHLGCTPIRHGSEVRFRCPYHGSVSLQNGVNIAGSAPVPLYRAAISLDLTGNFVANKSQQENQPWELPFLPALMEYAPTLQL